PPPRCGLCDAPSCLLPLAQDGLDPRDLTTHRAELQRVRDRLGTAAERQAAALLHQERELLLQLVGLELPQRLGLLPRHATAPPASRTSTGSAAWRRRAPAPRAPDFRRSPRARTSPGPASPLPPTLPDSPCPSPCGSRPVSS